MTARFLIVTADDFGIGPATSAGILDLAEEGLLTATVLLVNSPFAADAVAEWRRRGESLALGWHPCLTLDAPILPPAQVPSLVRPDGRFWSLRDFLIRLVLRRIRPEEVAAELRAQLERFQDLVGEPPTAVNGHHHIHVLPGVGDVIHALLDEVEPLPYVRRVREPWASLMTIPGARLKRGFLNLCGRVLRPELFPGNNALVGLADPRFLTRALRQAAGPLVELTCHPGYLDDTLPGRDGGVEHMRRRVEEWRRLRHPSFRDACRAEGYQLISHGVLHAA